MLHILGMILKIAGILLGSILGICLFLFLLVLFVPIRYRVKGAYNGAPDVDARISWLFPVLSVRILSGEEGFRATVRIFGWRLEKREKAEPAEIFRKKERDRAEKRMVSEEPYVREPEPVSVRMEDWKEAEAAEEEQKKKLFTKIKCTISNICDKIKEIARKKERFQAFVRDEQNKEVFRLIKSQLICIWRQCRPRRWCISCHFGFEDPAYTGQVLAATAVFYPLYRDKIRLYPDFEKQVFCGEGYGKGRIRIFPIVLIILRLWKNKQIKAMLYKFMK